MWPVLLALAIVTAFVVLRGLSWRQTHRQRTDASLVIRPPRPFVDPDGRSDFRPELRELAAQRRAKEFHR